MIQFFWLILTALNVVQVIKIHLFQSWEFNKESVCPNQMSQNKEISVKLDIIVQQNHFNFADYYHLVQEMSNAQIMDGKMIRGNITSSIDISKDESYFVAVTRLRALNSSMYSYQLELFNLTSLQQIALTHIYDTYSQLPHPCKILPNDNTIVVATKYHMIFYDSKLKIKHQVLHHQIDVNDLSYSPDSRLVNMVSSNMVLIWDTRTFDAIIFPFDIPNARSSKYSPDNKYLGVASTSTIGLYSVRSIGGTYTFVSHPQYKADIGTNSTMALDFFTSFDFNPINSLQIVIGFANQSPRLFNFDGNSSQYKKIAKQDQPYSTDNFKIVKFMPDGKRIFSSDYLQGVGLWPGLTNQSLLYKESFLFFSPLPYDGGRKLLGYNWQTIKLAEIQFYCGIKGNTTVYNVTCPCGNDQFWSLTAKSCQNCKQGIQNICFCDSNSYFDANLQQCIYNCSKLKNTVAFITDSTSGNDRCFCDRGYIWKDGQCIFDCQNIMFSNGPTNSSTSCSCLPGFIWNDKINTCSCSENSELVKQNDKLYCSCLPSYQFDSQSNKCLPMCNNITNSIGRNSDGGCQCKIGYMFIVTDNIQQTNIINTLQSYKSNNMTIMQSKIGGCIRNCSMYNFTQGYDDNDGCICRENMIWNMSTSRCMLNCNKIINGGDLITYSNGTQVCTCASLYSWIPENIQCGRNCSNVSYVNRSKYSTTISCPCINKFNWNQATNKCEIDCSKINYTEPYSIDNSSSCACRNTVFHWNETEIACVINCKDIWGAKERVDIGECTCQKGQKFNKTGLSCSSMLSVNAFSQPWVWALLGIGGLFILIVIIVLVKFCWNFTTNRAKLHQKKLKKNKQEKRRKKQIILEKNVPSTERFALVQ